MALVYFPTCGTAQGPITTTGDVTLREPAVPSGLTGVYVATTHHVLVKGFEFVTFKFVYLKGDETRFLLRPEGSADGGTTWFQLGYRDTFASGYSPLVPDVNAIVAASYAAGTTNIALPPAYTGGHAIARMSIAWVGGTPTGTLGVYASGETRVR